MMAVAMQKDLVSISIVTFNHAHCVQSALESALRQTHRDIEIIVVDNASTDGTRELLARFENRITVVLNETNTGFCAAHNEAIRRGRGEFVLVMNPDIVLEPDYVANAVEAMRREGRIGTIAGFLMTRDEEGREVVDSAGLGFDRARHFFLYGYGLPVEPPPARGYVFGCDGSLALYRRNIIDAVSANGEFFDEMYFAYKDSFDLSWRAQLAGWQAFFEPSCRAIHHHLFKPGDLKLRSRMPAILRFHSVKNDLIHLVKNEDLASFGPDALFILVRQFMMLVYNLAMDWPALKAYAWFFGHLGELRRRRALFASRWVVRPGALRRQFVNVRKPVPST